MKLGDETFLTKSKFSKMVQDTVIVRNMSYMDAILHICEQNNLEIEDVRKYVTPAIKDKIEAEAMNLNMMPKSDKLPFV